MKLTLIKLGTCLLAHGVLGGCHPADMRKEENVTMNSVEPGSFQTVTSRDGTKIAFEKRGEGPPLILINGALADRAAGSDLAAILSKHFTVYIFDRRGRGSSGDTQPYAVQREVEDIAALVDHAGGTARLVGFSSGAALALEAASALGAKITSLALYEAPYDDAAGVADKWKSYRAEQAELLAEGRRADAVLHHLKYVGVPDAMIAQMQASPAWAQMESMAHTLPYDATVVGADRSVPVERAASINSKVLVMDGGASRKVMPFMQATADTIARAIPGAQRHTVEGQGHNVSADAIAPILIEFLSPS